MRRCLTIAALISVALMLSTASAEQNIVANGSAEAGGGAGGPDDRIAESWTFFGGDTIERSNEENLEPLAGSWSLKIFGGEGTVGAYQDISVAEGANVTISAQLYTRDGDAIDGDAQAKIKIEFLDAASQSLGATELVVLDAGSATDTWTPASLGPIEAPATTAVARMVCVWTYSATSFGSAYWDDCTLTVGAGGNLLDNADFEIAGISGSSPFGIDEWTGFGTQEKSSDAAYDGLNSAFAQVGGAAGEYSGLYQDMAELAAGDRLFLHCRVWIPAATPLTGTSAAAIKLEFYPTSGSSTPPPEEALDFDANDPADSWELVSYSTIVPEDISLARVVLLSFDEDPNNGPVYFESAWAERSSQVGVNQLDNPSFEQGTSGANGLISWTEFRGLGCSARKNAFEVPAMDGVSVLKIVGDCVAGVFQDIEVAPGETLTISSYLRSNSAEPYAAPGVMAGVKVEWVSGVVPPWIDIGGAPNNTAEEGTPTDQWMPLWIDYTMPAGTAALVRYTLIVAQGDAAEAAAYFDACEAVVMNLYDGADIDADDDEDLGDFVWLQRTFRGTGVTSLEWNKYTYDFDEDGDVDITDWNFFEPRLVGPN